MAAFAADRRTAGANFRTQLCFKGFHVDMNIEVIDRSAGLAKKVRMGMDVTVIMLFAVLVGADLDDLAEFTQKGEIAIYGAEADVGKALL